MQKILVMILLAIAASSCVSTTTHTDNAIVAHAVLIWLKEPGNTQDRQRVIAASKRLAVIDGVVRVQVGQPIMSERNVVDDSFDIGLYIEFSSARALQNYADDPLHKKIVRDELAPVVDHYIAYDFDIDR